MRILAPLGLRNKVAQLDFFPGIIRVILVKTLAMAISFEVIERRKEWLGSHVEHQTNRLTNHPGMLVPSAETTFVVHLQIIGDAQFYRCFCCRFFAAQLVN